MRPIGEVLGQLETAVLPDGWQPQGGVALVRCRTGDSLVWAFRYFGEEIDDEDLLGAMTVQRELILKRALDSYEDG